LWLAILDVVSVTGIAILFGLILKYVPETKVQWSEIRVGAIATALLFTIGKILLGLYLGKTTPGSPSLVVMVIWVYYSAQIFYFGAEFTHVYACSKRAAKNCSPLRPIMLYQLFLMIVSKANPPF
jgi:membrane protein